MSVQHAPEGLTGTTASGEVLRVREVWDDNLEHEFELIRNVVEQYPYVAMDTEFPGVVARPVGNFKSSREYHYKALKMNVDMLKLIQLGLTFTDAQGNLPRWNGELCVWQFNFKGFRLADDVYAQDSIELLKQSGIDFDRNESRGIDVQRFGDLLMSSGIVLNEDIRWITFHSGYDFGYLLKILTCMPLPGTEQEFFELLNIYFPHVFDIKYMMKFCDNLHGGLNKLAEMLEVQRIGPQHQAGSDSLLTSFTFIKLATKFFSGVEGASKHMGILYGLGVDGESALKGLGYVENGSAPPVDDIPPSTSGPNEHHQARPSSGGSQRHNLTREQLRQQYDRSIALNNGRLIVHGIFARADTKNNNKRVYSKNLLKREVAKYEAAHILRGTALGELDHPNYASEYFKSLNLPNISHQVLEVVWRGDQLWGSIEILPTPSGLLLWELYAQGIKLGVSSRGWASLREDPARKCVYVEDDFELITWDFVTEPSTKDAFLLPIQQTFRQAIPSQRKAVQIAHLGHGVAAMDRLPELPPGSALAARIQELQWESGCGRVSNASGAGAAGAGLRAPDVAVRRPDQQQPPSRLRGLDPLLRYGHYIVHQDAPYLNREKDVRNYHSHLAMFASRAHLAATQPLMSKADLNALIMQDILKQDVVATCSARQSQGAKDARPLQQQQQQQVVHAECQGQPADEANSQHPWSGHPQGPGAQIGEASSGAARGGGVGRGGQRHVPALASASASPCGSPALPRNASSAGAAGAPTPPRRSGTGSGSRVFPYPPLPPVASAAQSPLRPTPAAVPPEVALEFKRIRATMDRYAIVQQRFQRQYVRELSS